MHPNNSHKEVTGCSRHKKRGCEPFSFRDVGFRNVASLLVGECVGTAAGMNDIQLRNLKPREKSYRVSDGGWLSRSKIYKLIQEGRFPAPIRVTANVSAWVDSEVAEGHRHQSHS